MATKEKQKNSLAPIHIFEIVFYTVMGAIALWGLVYMVLGLIITYYPATSSNTPMMGFNDAIKKYFGLTPLWWGVILFAFGAICIAIALICVDRTVDKEREAEERRAARLAHIKAIEAEEEALENEVSPQESPVAEPIPVEQEAKDVPLESVPEETQTEETAVEETAPAEESVPKPEAAQAETPVEAPAPEETPKEETPAEPFPEPEAPKDEVPTPEAPAEEPAPEPEAAPTEDKPEA